ncbi:MAG TPA: metallophosphoesterase family protein [Telluria sp.]|nr:metallophosphoesterase family protein [Telluria sp.]
MVRIGLISDTHGLLRPEALAALAGCDHIVHGGDIGGQAILDQLAAIAPLTAVRGNNDFQAWATAVPDTARVTIAGLNLFAVHDIATIGLDPAAEGIDVVIYGHSHKPLAERRGAVLYLNPGSAGPRRFSLPVSVAQLTVDKGEIAARIIALAV